MECNQCLYHLLLAYLPRSTSESHNCFALTIVLQSVLVDDITSLLFVASSVLFKVPVCSLVPLF